QQELVQRQAASKAAYDTSVANRDNAKAKLLQAQADTKQAQINLDYTRVVAPFDGVVTARQVSIGELVGTGGTQVLATIVLLVPTVALGSDQAGRYVLTVNGENTVEQRKVEVGPVVGDMTVIENGLKPDDRVVVSGLLRAIPGQKVDPKTLTAAAK